MSRPALAAITFDPQGGGVATVARLLRRVLRDKWDTDCPVTTLVTNPGTPPTFASRTPTRVWFGLRLAANQAAGRCDWLFFSHLSLALVQRFVPPMCRRPYAVFLHDIEAWGPLDPVRRQVLAGAFLRVANSSFTARRVMAAHPGVGPVHSCPLALEPPDLPGRGEEIWPGVETLGRHVVLVVGRMSSSERYKGHDQLIEAWPRVVAQVADARLVFAGTGDDIPRLRARAAALGVAESLICPGFVSRATLEALYRRAAVFAMPSRREGFGLVYLEAMAHGLPCIGSTHDAAGELIQDGISGFLVDQSDIGLLAERIALLLTDERRRRQMGDRGARRVAEHFTYERFAARLVSLVPLEHRASLPAASATRRAVL